MPPSAPPRVFASTLGCKLNQYESEAILTQFRAAGFAVSDQAETADVCVVNTCAVTSTAERKARSLLRSIRRRNSDGLLVAAGCMAERTPASLAAIPGVDVVVGNREKEHILDFIRQRGELPGTVHVGETAAATTFGDGMNVEGLLGRTRAYLKVQDGCSQKCTYCIIPRLRGRGRSLPVSEAVDRARRLIERGFKELVVTGVALGTYGSDLGSEDGLVDLLVALDRIEGAHRIRLGSVEPWAVSDRLLVAIAQSARVCAHLHLPLQAAEDSILHRMNRRYDIKNLRHVFDYAYSLRDDWGFGSDIIVGFPGEDKAKFSATRSFVADAPVAYLHVFPFSARPGTPAVRLDGQVNDGEKSERVAAMREVDQMLRRRFRERHLHTTQTVLLESRFVDGRLAGHGENYLDVYVDAGGEASGTVHSVRITGLHPQGVIGELVEQHGTRA